MFPTSSVTYRQLRSRARRSLRSMARKSGSRIWAKTARIQVYDRDGLYLGITWRTPDYRNGRPSGLSIDRNGNVIVSDSHYHCFRIYSPDGVELCVFGGAGGTRRDSSATSAMSFKITTAITTWPSSAKISASASSIATASFFPAGAARASNRVSFRGTGLGPGTGRQSLRRRRLQRSHPGIHL